MRDSAGVAASHVDPSIGATGGFNACCQRIRRCQRRHIAPISHNHWLRLPSQRIGYQQTARQRGRRRSAIGVHPAAAIATARTAGRTAIIAHLKTHARAGDQPVLQRIVARHHRLIARVGHRAQNHRPVRVAIDAANHHLRVRKQRKMHAIAIATKGRGHADPL